MNLLIKTIASFGLALIAFPLFADAPSVNKRPRMLSMGGAGVAILGDKDAAMINPAGLADIEETNWQIFPLIFEAPFDLGVMNSALDFNDTRESDEDDSVKRAALDEFLRDAGTTTLKSRVNIYPNYTSRWWGVGVHMGLLVEALVDTNFALNGVASNQMADTRGTAGTAGLILGAGYGFFENSLQVGATIKPLYRHGIFKDDQISVLDVAIANNSDVRLKDRLLGDSHSDNAAFGVGLDLGVKYKLQDYGWGEGFQSFVQVWKPAVAISYQDIGDTRFLSDKPKPQNIKQSVSAGIAFHPDVAFTKNTFALDFRNINEKQEFLNKLHVGVESVLWNFWAIRAGLGQSYVSGGMGLDLPFFEVDVYVSAEEAGQRSRIKDERVLGIRLAATL